MTSPNARSGLIVSYWLISMLMGWLHVFGVEVQAKEERLDSATLEALKRTQELLKNANQREKYYKDNETARVTDDEVKKLAGQDSDLIYSLSSEIFEELIKKTNGDYTQLNRIIEEARKSPASFFDSLSSKSKAQIKRAGEKLSPKQDPK